MNSDIVLVLGALVIFSTAVLIRVRGPFSRAYAFVMAVIAVALFHTFQAIRRRWR